MFGITHKYQDINATDSIVILVGIPAMQSSIFHFFQTVVEILFSIT